MTLKRMNLEKSDHQTNVDHAAVLICLKLMSSAKMTPKI